MNEENEELEIRGEEAESVPAGGDQSEAQGQRLRSGEEKGESGSGTERTSSDGLRAHLASLLAQGEALRREIPDFDLGEALRDGDFLRLTSPQVGVSVRRAWYALHGEEREKLAGRRAAEDAARRLALSAARPREGGRGVQSGALSAADYRSLDPGSRAALRQRIRDAAARGEKVYPT